MGYGIFWVPPGESSCPDGSEYVWQRGVESLQGPVLPARSWEMPVERELPAKIGRCWKKLTGRNLIVEQNPPERKFLYMLKIFSQEDFALKSKLRPWYFFQHLFLVFFPLEISVNFGRP